MKFGILLIGIAFIFQGIFLLIGIDIYGAKSGTIKASLENGLLFLVLGIITLILSKYIKKEKYSICPKCKETYTYNNLKDGMCPKCDVKTTDLEEYYKKK